jgi:hypothetical protein
MARHTPPAVWFQTRPSRRLLSYLLLLHAAAGVALATAALPWPGRLAGAILVSANLLRELRIHYWRRGARATRAVHWQADGVWLVDDGLQRRVSYRDCRIVLAEPLIVLLQLRDATRRHWLLLLRDSADPEPLRQLRVRLRRQACRPGADQGSPLAGR